LKGLLPLALGPLLATVVYAFAIYGEFVPFPTKYHCYVAPYSILAIVIVGIISVIVLSVKRNKSELDAFGTDANKAGSGDK
jgi:uncharacterized protein YhhL (DUF1145 family)